MPGFVYILVSACGTRTYVGWTNDLERRLAAHNAGQGARSTRGRQWRIAYAERCDGRIEAMRREWALKRDRKMRARVRGA
ncbi:MAG: GIY-YIG nuclease family protein [Hyphomonadaceae bacterium]